MRKQIRQVLADTLLNSVIGARVWPRGFRPRLLRAAGVPVSQGRGFESHVTIRAGRALTIGPGSFVNTDCLFNLKAPITIGSNVFLAHRVALLTNTHEVGGSDQRAARTIGKPIVIEDGCWLGAGVTVLPGVTIGRGCIVAAGAVVTADCQADGVYAGIPARRVRTLEP